MENKVIESNDKNNENEDSLSHHGVGHLDGGNSGRYPWGSGDSPFQTSGDFYSRVLELKRKGMKETEIANALGLTTTKLRTAYSISKNDTREQKITYIKTLQKEGLSNIEIGKKLGEKFNPDKSPIGESTVRSLLNENAKTRMKIAAKTAEELKKIVNEKGMIDVGVGVEKYLNNRIGISSDKLKTALASLVMDGYEVYSFRTEQLTNPGKTTTFKVLCPPGTKYYDVYKAAANNKIKSITEYASSITRDDGRPNEFIYPSSLNSKRLMIRYAEDGGTAKDGVVELRRNVKDLSLGNSNYSQVRILVDGTHYIKGMAVYGNDEDFPEGVDAIFNSNKFKSKIGDDKLAALKSIEDNIAKDPTNPFGSYIKENGGQSFYDDPKGKYTDPLTGKKQSLSLINKRSDEGDWSDWSKELPSQFLSKQPQALINKQLRMTENDKLTEFNEIMSLTNPTIKRKLLEDFAEDCDSSSVHLKAARLPGQTYKVILPLTTISDNEIYDPDFKDGTKVALIRYPHGGIFEIPILTVNNSNKEGKSTLSTTPADAVGISAHSASVLSGADFDGDTVMVIPFSEKIKISSKHPLQELEGFDTKLEYGPDPNSKKTINGVEYATRNGHEFRRMNNTAIQMGVISNLITDMTLKGASSSELARAVKHSMVVIDAEKHFLDYAASEKDNNIQQLKDIYQNNVDPITGRPTHGASTLISRSKSEIQIPVRKPGAYFTKDNKHHVQLIRDDANGKVFEDPKTGEVYKSDEVHKLLINPKTGEKVYTYTGESYNVVRYKDSEGKEKKATGFYKPNDTNLYYKNDKGEHIKVTNEKVELNVLRTQKSTKMYEATDAHTLSSGTPQEEAYANFANFLKDLGNQARKEAFYIEDIPYSASARQVYQKQVDSLEYKYNQAIMNKPRERQAQLLATSRVNAKVQDNPREYADTEDLNKLKQVELKRAREIVGAARQEIYIEDDEWNAIQSGAISKTMLKGIIDNADSDRLKQLAMPRDFKEISPYKLDRIKSMKNAGYNTDEIARHLKISSSTVTKYLSGKE